MTLTFVQPWARLLISGGIIFAALAAVAGTASALFSDSVGINDSTFATGNVDLLISTDTGSYQQDPITGPNVSGMMPGDTRQFFFWLQNSSTTPVDLITTISDVVANNAALKDDLSVGFVCDYDNNNTIDGSITAKSLTQWETGDPVPGLGTLAASQQARCRMDAILSQSSTASSSSVNFDTLFTGTQPTPAPTPTP